MVPTGWSEDGVDDARIMRLGWEINIGSRMEIIVRF